MSSEITTNAPWVSAIRSLYSDFKLSFFSSSCNTHDLTRQQGGSDFMFEALGDGLRAYITGQMGGVKKGDRLLLEVDGSPKYYRIEAVDYYSLSSDLWTAYLTCVS